MVPAGGWGQGGGHGPLTARYGLGADQFLEVKLVTADGQYLVCNEVSNPDLFWAVRGGGGGTFGVVVEATLKVYPDQPMTVMTWWVTSDSYRPSALNQAVFYLLQQLPALHDRGIGGYFLPIIGTIRGMALHPNQNVTEVNAIWKPILEEMQSFPGMKKFQTKPLHFENYKAFYGSAFGTLESHTSPKSSPQTPPSNRGRAPMDSHFLTRQHMADPKIMDAFSSSEGFYTLLMVQPTRSLGNGNNTSAHPAWREAGMYVTGFKIPHVTNLNSLRDFAPGTGAYFNEAHWTEPNWQQAFWGTNYPRLAKIKTQYDPSGLFWVSPGINAEHWEVRTGGRVCKVSATPEVGLKSVAPEYDYTKGANYIFDRANVLGTFDLIEMVPPNGQFVGIQPEAVEPKSMKLPI